MAKREPVDFRVGDLLRLRKAHPCGGWTWRVTRLGADIGLRCATCGRRIMLERPVLERRVKRVIERGPEVSPCGPVSPADDQLHGDFPCDLLGLQAGDLLEASEHLDVSVVCYYLTQSETCGGKLRPGDRVCVSEAPPAGSSTALVEPIAYELFEQQFVPGGVRTHPQYRGYAISIECRRLARCFMLLSRPKSSIASLES